MTDPVSSTDDLRSVRHRVHGGARVHDAELLGVAELDGLHRCVDAHDVRHDLVDGGAARLRIEQLLCVLLDVEWVVAVEGGHALVVPEHERRLDVEAGEQRHVLVHAAIEERLQERAWFVGGALRRWLELLRQVVRVRIGGGGVGAGAEAISEEIGEQATRQVAAIGESLAVVVQHRFEQRQAHHRADPSDHAPQHGAASEPIFPFDRHGYLGSPTKRNAGLDTSSMSSAVMRRSCSTNLSVRCSSSGRSPTVST